jgi:single-stranded-DNA-specific exonuclease
MRSRPTRWTCPPYELGAVTELQRALGLSATVATVLVRRGLGDPEQARRFLAADERNDPRTLPGAPAATKLVLGHVERGSRIAVYGDYDVDGVCSTAILLRTLRALGADPVWELPHRFGNGYGLSRAGVERFVARGVDLLITVDCGVTAVDEVAAARAAGLDVLVVDHHRPGETLPDCEIVHPALGAYACPELCAAGTALKLSELLRARAGLGASGDVAGATELGPPAELLELAALGTVCDLVPLQGENRRIVREGLRALSRTRSPGLRALMTVAGLEPGELDERAIGFRLGPRLNAAGRMQRADAALELLMTADEARAAEVARELDLLNHDRRDTELQILAEAEAAALPQASAGAVVVAGEGWHPGVVGIVASRLVERWGRPAVVISLDGERARGSGRSISAYDLHAGLAACAPQLRRFGGHRMAAGVELDAAAVEPFRRALAAHAGAALTPQQLIPVERVDAVVPGGSLGLGLAEELEQLRPFGAANPQPTLLVPAARLDDVVGMGEQRQHARFALVTGSSRARGVAFGSPPSELAGARGAPHDVAVRLELNRWNGSIEPRVVLRALCPTDAGELRVLGEGESFWERLGAEHARDPAAHGLVGRVSERVPVDRRGAGFAGVLGALLTSGESVLVAVADVPRRRAALEQLVAGLAEEGLAVASWDALRWDPELTNGFAHLVAFDPPPGGVADPLLRGAAQSHMAWGQAEVEFSLAVWREGLELRPALTATYRALRGLASDAGPAELEAALCGDGRYPRTPETSARVLVVLEELKLARVALDPPRVELLDAARTDLETSAAFRAYAARLATAERALGAAVAPAARAA